MIILGDHLTLNELKQVWKGESVFISDEAVKRMEATRKVVESIIEKGEPVYGVNTGVGRLAEISIDRNELEQLQVNIVRSHAVGVGEPLSREIVRAAMALRAHTLAQGLSGVRPIVAQKLTELLNADVLPVVPSRGSVGASGDLAPLAHIALTLIGEGEAIYRGQRLPSFFALKLAGIEPLRLQAKEGLALINGTQASTAVLAVALARSESLLIAADAVAAMTFEALEGVAEQFITEIAVVRPHNGARTVIQRFQKLIEGSQLTGGPKKRVQDAYSLRCIPQVHGAVNDTVDYVRDILEIEMNSVTDNPLVFPDGRVVSNGNFHGQPVAFVADLLATSMASLGSISERRTFRLLDPELSGLPAFLTEHSGLNSGMMMLQVTQAALVSENKSLAHPASVDSIPTSADQEDFVSMSMTAALKALQVVENVEKVLAIELIAALQALQLRGVEKTSPKIKKLHELARKSIPKLEADRIMQNDLANAIEFVRKIPEIFDEFLKDRE